MALTGQAKTDYQREYMRKRRSNAGSNVAQDSVRPKAVQPVRPEQPAKPKLVRPPGIGEQQWAYMQFKAGRTAQTGRTQAGGRQCTE